MQEMGNTVRAIMRGFSLFFVFCLVFFFFLKKKKKEKF